MTDVIDNLKVKFAVYNIGGLMEVNEGVEENILNRYAFSHPSYTVTTSLKRDDEKEIGIVKYLLKGGEEEKKRYYTRFYRKSVLWDFGDGYTVEGQYATHSYEKPGKYTISCTFFDIHRHGIENQYKINVVVKEVIPTELQLNTTDFSSAVKCSKMQQIQEIQATLSNNCLQTLNVVPTRRFNSKEEEKTQIEYHDLEKSTYSFLKRYWCFLKNEIQYEHRSGKKLYRDKLIPVKKYVPEYDAIYGSFEYDETRETNKLYFSFWWVNPYSKVEERCTKISYTNPDYDFLSETPSVPERISTNVNQVYLQSELDEKYTYVGARAFVDVYYRSDFTQNISSIFFNFDWDNQQSQPEIKSSRNFINNPPLGINISVVKNKKDEDGVLWYLSSDGFIHDDVTSEENDDRHIDSYLENGIVKGRAQTIFVLPIIRYGTSYIYNDLQYTEYSLLQEKGNYYIPKDLMYDDYHLRVNLENKVVERFVDGFDKKLSHVKCYVLSPIEDNINFTFEADGETAINVTVNALDENNINIPVVKQHKENFDELLEVYMPHRMFNEKNNLKDAMRAIFSKSGFFDYMLTYSDNFIDNISNYKTCFLGQFISILQSMGEDVTLFESNNFEGVNALRDFVRLLSINHGDLVGHVVPEEYDIRVGEDFKGINVGDQLFSSDILTVDNKSVIKEVERDGKHRSILEMYQSDKIIVHDKYTNETWLVDLYALKDKELSIGDYQYSWNWKMMFPKRFDEFSKIVAELKKKSVLTEEEKKKLEIALRDKCQIMDSYYEFYLLNPICETKRVGNFVDSDSITEEIESVEEWQKQWGISYKCLLKILSMYSTDVDNTTFIKATGEPERAPEDESDVPVEQVEEVSNVIASQEFDIESDHVIDIYHPFAKRYSKYKDLFKTKEQKPQR